MLLHKTTFIWKDGYMLNTAPQEEYAYQGCIDQRNKEDKAFYEARKQILEDTFVPLARRLVRERIQDGVTRLTILDIGCGDGPFLKACYRVCKEERIPCSLYGVDLDKQVLRHIKIPAKCVVASCTDLPFPAKKFDIVVCSQTVEHLTLEEVQETFAQTYRVLKPGGITYFETPNPNSLVATAMGSDWWMFLNLHTVLLSPFKIAQMLTDAGFVATGTTRGEFDVQVDEAKQIILEGKRKLPKVLHPLLRYGLVRICIALLDLGGNTVGIGKKEA